MSRSGVWAIVGVVVGLVASPASAQEAPFEWSGELRQGMELEVKGISGDIWAVLATGEVAEVVARKRGRDRDFDEVEIRVVERGSTVTICAVYGSWRGGRDCDHEDWDDDRSHRRSIDVSVDFEVRVPAGVEFVGSMISGDVAARDLDGPVEVSSVSGDVFVSTSDVGRGSTVSGSIEVEMGSTDWDDLDFSTVSGDITVYMPEDLDADVRFSSLSGDFDTDFDIQVDRERKRRWVGSSLRGQLGRGGRDLRFNTVSGDVELRRLRR